MSVLFFLLSAFVAPQVVAAEFATHQPGVLVEAAPRDYQIGRLPAYGPSDVADGASRTYMAPTEPLVIGGGVRTRVAGYRLDTWDESGGCWISGKTYPDEFSYTHRQNGTARTRLVWLWTNEVKTVVRAATEGFRVSVDGGPWCDFTNAWLRVGTEHAIRGSENAERVHLWTGVPDGTTWNDRVTRWTAYVTPLKPCAISVSVKAANLKDWNGGASGCWNDAGSWSPVGVPGPAHDVTIPPGATVVVSNAIDVASLKLEGDKDAETKLVFATKNATNRVARSVVMGDHTTMTHERNWRWHRSSDPDRYYAIAVNLEDRTGDCKTTKPEIWYRLDLAVGGDMTIATGAKIDVSQAGYGPGWSPDGRDITATGAATGKGALATHAGCSSCGYYFHAGSAKYKEAFGNAGGKSVYGSVRRPTSPGSGCYQDGLPSGYAAGLGGGGMVHLMVAGELNVEGQILSRSGVQDHAPQNGSGAGGSVWLEAAAVTGSGAVDVRGGDVGGAAKYAPNSSAGRIAIYQTVATANPANLTLKAGSAENVCGTVVANGANGSIYLENAGDATGRGELIVDYGDCRCFNLTNETAYATPCTNANCLLLTVVSLDGQTAFRQITVRNGGILTVPAGVTVTTDYLMDEHSQSENNCHAINANTTGYAPTEGAHYASPGCGTIRIVKGTLPRSSDPVSPEPPSGEPDPTPPADVSDPRGAAMVARTVLGETVIHTLGVTPLADKTFDAASATNNWFSYPVTETLASALAKGLVTFRGRGATLPDGPTCVWCFADVVDGAGFVARTEPVFATKLPVVKLTVDSVPTYRKESHAATIEVVGNGVYGDMPPANVEDIHVRGNYTALANYPKYAYKLKLERKANMFGMGKQKHWVLLANYFDPSQLNNRLAFDLARAAGTLAMDSEWVEVFMNGRYMGVYQFCEHIRIDKNRVDIHDWEDDAAQVAETIAATDGPALAAELEESLCSDWSWLTTRTFASGGVTYRLDDYPALPKSYDISGGYLVVFDNYGADEEETALALDGYGKYLRMANTLVARPQFASTNPEMCNTFRRTLEAFFQATQAPDGYFNGRHYTEMSDIDTMAGYWIVQAFTCNYDAIGGSRYAYQDQGGKLRWGPAWDFSDNAFVGCLLGNWRVVRDAANGESHNDHFQLNCYLFGYAGARDGVDNPFPFWADDPYFCLKLWEKWQQLKPFFAELLREDGKFDQYVAHLEDTGAVNQEAFTCGFRGQANAAWKYDAQVGAYKKMTYAELTSGLREFLERTHDAWTAVFESVDTLERALDAFWKDQNDTRARHPAFVADVADYAFTVHGNHSVRTRDAFADHTDVFVAPETDVTGTVFVGSANANSVAVFVNGISNGVYEVAHGAAEITVPAAQLTNPAGSRNMIQFVGLGANGMRLGQSYALVELNDALVPSPADDQRDNIRWWGFCGQPPEGDDDDGEFIILTNLNATASVSLEGLAVRICKTGDKVAKCEVTIGAGVTIAAGDCLRLERAVFSDGWKKITNGEVDLMLTSAQGDVFEEYHVSQSDLGVKGTGKFAARDFATADGWKALDIDGSPDDEPPVSDDPQDPDEPPVPDEPPASSHAHAFGPWVTNWVATCLGAGEAARGCVATDCTEPPCVEAKTIPPLGHDWGEWHTNDAPTAVSVGELRRYCRRAGCDAFESEVLATAVPPVRPDKPIPYAPRASDIGLARGPFAIAPAHVLTNAVRWANAHGMGILDLEGMDFAAMGINELAYLFNVEPIHEAVEAARAAFRFESISVGEVPSLSLLAAPNGDLKVQGAGELTGHDTNWTSPAMPFHRFFRAVLRLHDDGSTEAKSFTDIYYSGDQKLDIWIPQSETPVPCLMYIHGGGWNSGSKADVSAYRHLFLTNGWAYVAIDYRLAGNRKDPFPAQIVDCKEAVRFIRCNAKALKVDPEKIFVAGSSAGGHLAALLGTTSGVDFFSGATVVDDPDSRVAGVVDLFGPSDFESLVEGAAAAHGGDLAGHPHASALYAFFGVANPTQMSALHDFASPTAYVMQERAAEIPPFCILHSTGDPVVPYSQSTLLQSRLQAVGVSVELHAYDLDSHAVPESAFAEIVRFLSAQL